MSELNKSRRQIAIFLLLLFVFSAVFYCLILIAHKLEAGKGLYVSGLMWCPALAAIGTLKLRGRKLSELGWRWPATRYAVASWIVPLLYATIAYLFIWILGFGGFPNQEFMGQLVERMGLKASPTLSTAVYPVLIGADYNAGTPTWYGLTLFYGYGPGHFICLCLDAIEIGKSMDWCSLARQP